MITRKKDAPKRFVVFSQPKKHCSPYQTFSAALPAKSQFAGKRVSYAHTSQQLTIAQVFCPEHVAS